MKIRHQLAARSMHSTLRFSSYIECSTSICFKELRYGLHSVEAPLASVSFHGTSCEESGYPVHAVHRINWRLPCGTMGLGLWHSVGGQVTSLETVQLEKLDISHQVRAVQRFVDAWIVILCGNSGTNPLWPNYHPVVDGADAFYWELVERNLAPVAPGTSSGDGSDSATEEPTIEEGGAEEGDEEEEEEDSNAEYTLQ